jgi:membrane-bound metal-dependent hydrolase YbcI (DUF457 family)
VLRALPGFGALRRGYRALAALLSRFSFESRFILLGVLLGNLPDIDVPLSRFFGGHKAFHRTLTHSAFGNAVIVPLTALLVQKLLGGSPRVPYSRALWMTALCSMSHIATDYYNNYGVQLAAPFDRRFYSYGLSTVFDFQSVLYFYSIFEISRWNLLP